MGKGESKTDLHMTDKQPDQFVFDAAAKRTHIRRRPGMYFGGVDAYALHFAFFTLVENAVNQINRGRCNRVIVTLHDENTISIEDNGPGIPVHLYRDSGKPLLELVATEPGGKSYDEERDQLNDGSFGVRIASVNALSAKMTIEVKRDGYLWSQNYVQSAAQTELVQIRPLSDGEGTGTKITFTPDFTIFEPNNFDYEVISRRLRDIAFLTRASIELVDQRPSGTGKSDRFLYPNGLTDFVTHLNRDSETLHAPIASRQVIEVTRSNTRTIAVDVEIVLQYAERDFPTLVGYSNMDELCDYSSPFDGIVKGLGSRIYALACQSELTEQSLKNFVTQDMLSGLTLVLRILHPDPSYDRWFGHQIRFADSELSVPVGKILYDTFAKFVVAHPDDAARILKKCLKHQQLRMARH